MKSMKKTNFYFEAKEEYINRNKTIGNVLTISLAIAVSFILAFILWLELEFGLLSNFPELF